MWGSQLHLRSLLFKHFLDVSIEKRFPMFMSAAVSKSVVRSPGIRMASNSLIGRNPLLFVTKQSPQRRLRNTSAPSASVKTGVLVDERYINAYLSPTRKSSLTNAKFVSGDIVYDKRT